MSSGISRLHKANITKKGLRGRELVGALGEMNDEPGASLEKETDKPHAKRKK